MDVFVNGKILPLPQATVSVQDRGLLYGDGLFETIRAEAGRPIWLGPHLARLEQSARQLNIHIPPDYSWDAIIRELLLRNNLEHTLAAVKILITRGEQAALGLPATAPPTRIVFARKYEPPPPKDFDTGWPVITFPEPRHNFLGKHKSLNYLFCLAARQYALEQGGREGLILEADGTVSEGAATAIVWQEGASFFTPQADSALASVTVTVLRKTLTRHGASLVALPVTKEKLVSAHGVWLANSLMGLLPVSHLDGQAVAISNQTGRLNALLWSEIC